MPYKVIKVKDDVLVYDVDTPDDKMEFMDNIEARPGDVFRFSYNGWLQYMGNDFDNAASAARESDDAVKLLKTLQDSKL